jgi:hypothetical protein
MPLLRTMARTAVISGTATHVSNNVNRRQAARWQQRAAEPVPQPAVAPPTPPVAEDPMQRLEKLAALHQQGVLTDEEFAAQKARILATM